ncbi:MAG: thiamine diphosphokinase [Eubacteriaceae bacterium]
MIVLIFTNGSYDDLDFYRNYLSKLEDFFCISIDGGGEIVRTLEIVPDILIGDMDSISVETFDFFKNIKRLEFQKEKDETDTALGIRYVLEMAKEKTIEKVIIFGGIGTRIDHTLGNIYLLTQFLKEKIRCEMVNESNQIFLLDKEETLNLEVGTTVSLLPLGEVVTGITIKGFKYPILEGKMGVEDNPYGISNIVKSKPQRIKFDTGRLLGIVVQEN